jgi:hypothetical protein
LLQLIYLCLTLHFVDGSRLSVHLKLSTDLNISVQPPQCTFDCHNSGNNLEVGFPCLSLPMTSHFPFPSKAANNCLRAGNRASAKRTKKSKSAAAGNHFVDNGNVNISLRMYEKRMIDAFHLYHFKWSKLIQIFIGFKPF